MSVLQPNSREYLDGPENRGKPNSRRGTRRVITPAQDRHIRRRTRFLGAALAVLCFGGLAGRLAVLQMADPDDYAARAAGQQLRDTVLPAARGTITSADGRLLASSKTVWTIRCIPRELAENQIAPTAAAMAQILELDAEQTLQKLAQRQSTDCLLRRRVEKPMADAVRAFCAANGVTAVQVIQDTKRVYPEGHFMGGLLGFTDVDNQGLWGLELRYDEPLMGQNGRVLTAKNAWGYDLPEHYATLEEPRQGNGLQLTIDAHIQHYLESALAAAVQEHHVAARAVGIVMEVETGAVLAMSCQPDYDPNNPRIILDEETRRAVDALTGEERSAALQVAQQYQWRNKAISDLYEPGSVFKLVTASAALDTGACTPTTQFVCSGTIAVAGTKFHCANGHIHGLETFTQGLGVSCNPCFIQVGARLGKENFCRYFEAFGLRGATGVDLPGEINKSQYYTAEKMGPVELASCSFGQSSKISYLQMLTAVCAVVNGGRLMQPYLVAAVTDEDGRRVKTYQPQVKRQVLKPETSATMRGLMEYVVTDGTGKNAAVAGYRIGGKSGTSQKLDSENERARIASFVAVAPADAPKVAVLVCLDEPHSWTTSGGGLSAPVCAQVLAQTLPYLGIAPSYTEAEQQKYFATVPDLAGWRVASAKLKLSELGFEAEINTKPQGQQIGQIAVEGEPSASQTPENPQPGQPGRIAGQYPLAGTVLRKGSVVFLDTTGTVDYTAEE